MRKVESKQQNVKFSFCPSPVTIDKSADWGEGNLQQFPNGVFLKHDENTGVITHGVQPNEEGTAPVGWTHDLSNFKKLPIWLDKKLAPGTITALSTLDGPMNYEVKEESYLCYNDNGNGEPDMSDSWAQTVRELEKNYIL